MATPSRSRWVRRGPIEVGIRCDGASHRVRCDGEQLALLDHTDDPESILATLGGRAVGACFEVRDAWVAGQLGELPSELRAMAVERWRRAGVAPSSLRAFLVAIDHPPSPTVHVGGVHPAIDAAVWWHVLGERPRPDLMRGFVDIDLDASEACAWRGALGRPIKPHDVVAARRRGVASGYEARMWVDATGEIPSGAREEEWRAAGITDAFVALCWADVAGGVIAPRDVMALRARGLHPPVLLGEPVPCSRR